MSLARSRCLYWPSLCQGECGTAPQHPQLARTVTSKSSGLRGKGNAKQVQCQTGAGLEPTQHAPVMWLGHVVAPGSALLAGYMLDAESGGSGMSTSRVSESLPGSPLGGHLRRSGLPARRGTGVPGNGISLTLFRSGRHKPGLSPLVTMKFGESERGREDLRVTLLKY